MKRISTVASPLSYMMMVLAISLHASEAVGVEEDSSFGKLMGPITTTAQSTLSSLPQARHLFSNTTIDLQARCQAFSENLPDLLDCECDALTIRPDGVEVPCRTKQPICEQDEDICIHMDYSFYWNYDFISNVLMEVTYTNPDSPYKDGYLNLMYLDPSNPTTPTMCAMDFEDVCTACLCYICSTPENKIGIELDCFDFNEDAACEEVLGIQRSNVNVANDFLPPEFLYSTVVDTGGTCRQLEGANDYSVFPGFNGNLIKVDKSTDLPTDSGSGGDGDDDDASDDDKSEDDAGAIGSLLDQRLLAGGIFFLFSILL